MRKSINIGQERRMQPHWSWMAILCSIGISTAFAQTSIVAAPGTFSKEATWNDGTNFHFRVQCASRYPHFCVFIDNDDNPVTGYTVSSIGADYMIEDDKLYHYEGVRGTGWKWNSGISVVMRSTPGPNTLEVSVPIGLIGNPPTAGVVCEGMDDNGNAVTDPTPVRLVQPGSSGGDGGSSGGGGSSILPAVAASGFSNEEASDDGVNFYFRAVSSVVYPHYQVLIDTKNYTAGFALKGMAADYMIQDDKLYYYSKGADGGWVWGEGTPNVVRSTPASNTFEFSVPLAAIGSPSTAKIIFQAIDANGITVSDHILTTFIRGSTSDYKTGPVDDSQEGWIFSGMTEVDDYSCKGGMEHAGGPSTYAAYTFSGSGVDIYATTGPSIEVDGRTHKLGRMKILVDGKSQGEYSLYQTSVTYQSKVYSVTGLTRGNHVLQLESNGGWIDVDFIQISNNEEAPVASAP